MIESITESPLKNKRFRVVINNKKFDFGLDTGSTYIDHHDIKKRENYRKRHLGNVREKYLIEHFLPSPALLSYYLLWGESTDLGENIIQLNRKLKE